jgi:hypothetical protein
MAANTSPIFVKSVRNSYATTGTSANTLFDGTGTVATVFTADPTNGSKVETVTLANMGSNVATAVRFFINNGSSNATATNNALVSELTWATNAASQVAASTIVSLPLNLYLPAGYKLNVTVGTAIASGIMVVAQGGDY